MARKCTEQNAITPGMQPRFSIASLTRGGRWIPLFSFLLFIMLFEILPFFRMALLSLETPSGGISLLNYYNLASQKFQLIALKNSITLSLVSSLLGLIIGIVGANALTKLKESVRNRILVLTNLTSNFAGVPLAFSYIVLLGTNGLLTLGLKAMGFPLYQHFSLYSWAGLTLVYIYFQVPLAIMLLYPACLGLRSEWKDAVRNLGGNDLQYWRYVGLPTILPSLSDTFSILFANAMGAYATAYALTSGNYALAPLRIGNLIAGNVELNPNLAATISITMAISIIGFMSLSKVLTNVLQRRRKYDLHQ